MSTVIGTVTLDRDMIFSDEYSYNMVSAESVPTIGGGVVVQEFMALEAGRNVTLVSTDTQGMQLKSTVDDLKALCDSGAGNTYTLTISSNSQTFTKTVRFRNELDGGAVVFEPVQVRQGLHDDAIYYMGSVFLMVI
jgi:hypothetical protein